jgi:CAAX protease family protein
MSSFVRKYPAPSLLILAMILGWGPIAAVSAGLLPAAASQLGALSAGLAGIILAAVEGRKGGLRELLGRILIWRVGVQWWAFALLGTVIPAVAGLYFFHLMGGPTVEWGGLKPLSSLVLSIIILTVLAGLGEEFGWRGFAMPRLQAHHSALGSSLIVGLIWGIWHIALFFTPGTVQSEWRSQAGLIIPVVGYTVFCMAWAIQYTWVFNNTKGSVLLAAVVHGAGNAFLGDYINVYRGHFGGILAFAAVMVVTSLIIVVLAGPANLSRTETRNMLSLDAAETHAAQNLAPAQPGS